MQALSLRGRQGVAPRGREPPSEGLSRPVILDLGVIQSPEGVAMRFLTLAAAAVLALGAAACADVEELFSRYVQVFKPQGTFVQRLIKLTPGVGDGWRAVEDPQHGLRLFVPAAARVE